MIAILLCFCRYRSVKRFQFIGRRARCCSSVSDRRGGSKVNSERMIDIRKGLHLRLFGHVQLCPAATVPPLFAKGNRSDPTLRTCTHHTQSQLRRLRYPLYGRSSAGTRAAIGPKGQLQRVAEKVRFSKEKKGIVPRARATNISSDLTPSTTIHFPFLIYEFRQREHPRHKK